GEAGPAVERRVGDGAHLEDLLGLEVEDVPGHVDQAAGDGEVDRSVLVDPFLQVLDEGEVPFEERRGGLVLADERAVEHEVPEHLLGRLPGDGGGREQLGGFRFGDRHRASSGGTASGARAFSRPSTSWISSRSIPTTREHPSPRIVTPNRW